MLILGVRLELRRHQQAGSWGKDRMRQKDLKDTS